MIANFAIANIITSQAAPCLKRQAKVKSHNRVYLVTKKSWLGWRNKIKKRRLLAQYLLPHKIISKIADLSANCEVPWVKNYLINYFIQRYAVNMGEAVISDPFAYTSYNKFFTRKLKTECRPIDTKPATIVSPADGAIAQIGKINGDKLLQAKGHNFSVQSLMANDPCYEQFIDGSFATIYLAPKDYHRVHMPLSGKLLETFFIPGKLFSVNHKTAQSVPNLFARNERLVSIFETEAGPMAIILVGAMLVGSINTVWGSTYISKSVKHQDFADQTITLEKGAEMGHFKMGSTVILLFANNRTALEQLPSLATVKMGQLIGEIKTH